MIDLINTLARYIGYLVLAAVSITVLAVLWFKLLFQPTVSPEVKRMAQETNPNDPVANAAMQIAGQEVFNAVRDLQRGEALRADPKPLTIIDSSVSDATQREIEHILDVLSEAGYHTQPLPETDNYRDGPHYSSCVVGVWHTKPTWHIVNYHGPGSWESIEEVDLPLPERWKPLQ